MFLPTLSGLTVTIQFIEHARRELCYKAFVAEVDGIVVGSSGSQLFAGLTNVLEEQHRKYGYIWGVYVEPPCRGKVSPRSSQIKHSRYLKSIGCASCPHASPSGKPVYSTLGFSETNEMRLDLI